MRVRQSDIQVEGPHIHAESRDASGFRVVREIPLWGILTFMGIVAAQAVGLYYGQQRMVEQMSDQRIAVKDLSLAVQGMQTALQNRERDLVVLQMKVEQLDQRVGSNERRLDSAPKK